MWLSVIVPLYNVEKYLHQCLDTLTKQNYENSEVILVDDGSTDGSIDIAREYARAHKNILIVSQKNGGQSNARNIGVELIKNSALRRLVTQNTSDDSIDIKGAYTEDISIKSGYSVESVLRHFSTSGNELHFDHNNIGDLVEQRLPPNQFVAFVDADDYVKENSRGRIMGVASDNGADLVMFSCDYVFSGIKPWYMENDERILSELINRYGAKPISGKELFSYYQPGHFSCVVTAYISTNVLNKGKIRFASGMIYEDFVFGVRVFAYASRIKFLNEVHYFYRIRPGSTCGYDGWKKIKPELGTLPPFLNGLRKWFGTIEEIRTYSRVSSQAIMLLEINKEFRGFLDDRFLDNLTIGYEKKTNSDLGTGFKIDPLGARANLRKSLWMIKNISMLRKIYLVSVSCRGIRALMGTVSKILYVMNIVGMAHGVAYRITNKNVGEKATQSVSSGTTKSKDSQNLSESDSQ